MAKRKSKSQPTWTDVKTKLKGLDRAGVLGLIQDLYAMHKDNQTFLHARFSLGENVLEPYKKTIDRWLWPDLFRKQDTSVSQAKQAISAYKKAVGDPEGLAELMASIASGPLGFGVMLAMRIRDTSMHWCACSSRPLSSQTHYQSTAGTTLSPG